MTKGQEVDWRVLLFHDKGQEVNWIPQLDTSVFRARPLLDTLPSFVADEYGLCKIYLDGIKIPSSINIEEAGSLSLQSIFAVCTDQN